MRILLDKNIPVGVRRFLTKHEVRTIAEMGWPEQLKNGELLDAAEESNFDVLLTSDQNIRFQQNLRERKLAFIVLGSNIWPLVREYSSAITAAAEAAIRQKYTFIEIPLPTEPR